MPRLPQPGSDTNTWGDILNEFLSSAHNNDGTIKDTGVVAAKADDSTVIHNVGSETIDGIKTFSSSPVVPTPTTNTQAASKAYVDATASAGTPDADATTKGKLQLAGDLSGTAANPTVPGLASKAESSALTAHTSNTSNPHGVTKAQVILANVDNTSDANKPVSTATQSALDLKAPLASPTFTGTVTVPDGSFSAAKLSFDPATQTELDAKVTDAINDGTTTIAPSQNAVFDALALKQNVLGFTPENTANKGVASGYAALGVNTIVPTAQLATGTANSTTYLRGDQTWATVSGGSGNMNTTTYDPAAISQQVVGTTATQTLTNKTLTSPVVNTPTGITKSDVGLANVDNVSSETIRSASTKGFVNHGATAGTARPTGYASVEWFGSVQPTNMTAVDTWVNTA